MKKAVCYRVSGLVQGVGFRPTVFSIAHAMGLAGHVGNDPQGVFVHLEGDSHIVDQFPDELMKHKPPLARIDRIEGVEVPCLGVTAFSIAQSDTSGEVKTAITADAAICEACLQEIRTPGERRYHYAFTNCTHCGPRLTITRHLPYDRRQTSMAKFPLCPQCLEEYKNPLDRRFHAEPIACPVCGPQLRWRVYDDPTQEVLGHEQPLKRAAQAIRDGFIVAIKGLGGFHLACDAMNEQAVKTLRTRKGRSEKPFAVMVSRLEDALYWCDFHEPSQALLTGKVHPIICAPQKPHTPPLIGVKDGLTDLGVMLAYTPLHALLFDELEALMPHRDSPVTLVMTSANPSDLPLVTDNDQAWETLRPIADMVLDHNRDIVVGCDDSVCRQMKDDVIVVRRARGMAPESIPLPKADSSQERLCKTPMSMGAYLKNTAALFKEEHAYLTPHIGSLKNVKTLQTLQDSLAHLRSIFEITPDTVVCDMHPDMPSTHLGFEYAQAHALPVVSIYHHVAHIGVVMAERQLSSAWGWALDGVGLGEHQALWGGEAIYVNQEGWSRLASLWPIPLVGGDKVAHEPWRTAMGLLWEADRHEALRVRYGSQPFSPLMMQSFAQGRATPSSACGRLFDGIASLVADVHVQHDEAWGPMCLEALAQRALEQDLDRYELPAMIVRASQDAHQAPFVLDWRPTVAGLIDARQAGIAPERLALAFHEALARGLVSMSEHLLATYAELARELALTGGVMMNRVLDTLLQEACHAHHIAVYRPLKVPAGDGGLSLGQAYLACQIQSPYSSSTPSNPATECAIPLRRWNIQNP